MHLWQAKNKLAMLFVRRVAYHQMLGRSVDVSQAALQNVRCIDGRATGVVVRLCDNVHGDCRGVSDRAAQCSLELEIRCGTRYHGLPRSLVQLYGKRASSPQLQVALPNGLLKRPALNQ